MQIGVVVVQVRVGLSWNHPKLKLSDNPGERTARNIKKPIVDELLDKAEQQGISYEELLEVLAIRCNKYKKQKPEIIIPTEDATAFYFNEKYSTRSWTELCLFLLKFNVKLPKRNDIDIEKKNLHPTIISQEIKSFVHYPDLIDDTVQGNFTIHFFFSQK